MSLFSNPHPPDSSLEEGTVLQVDPVGNLCKVKTIRGQILQEVQWLLPVGGSHRGADRISPSTGDRVLLSFGLGYPLIIGFLPRLQSGENTTPINIDSDTPTVDTGSYGPGNGNTLPDQNKPKDWVSGDRVLTSIGGAFLGLLRGGSAILRANRGTELSFFNFKNLVRLVSRNWAHFTDMSSDVIHNFGGRLYRYVGYAKTFGEAKVEDYKLNFYFGDVKAAETIKTNYDIYSGTPASDSILYKEQVVQTSPFLEVMQRTLNDAGEEMVVVRNNTHFTRVSSTAEQVLVAWNDENTVVITENSIHLIHKDGADLVLNSSGITGSMGSSQVSITTSEAKMLNGGHQVSVTSGGVAIS